jgi:hypothetical protein
MKKITVEPNWHSVLKFMDYALRTNSVLPEKREEFQKSRNEVAAYVTHLDKGGK